jgi:ribose 5-phosphate isomerase A
MGQRRDRAALKRDAAEAALVHVRSDTTIGLGSGSTAACFIEALGRHLADGRLTDVRGVPTSRASQELAEASGVPLASPEEADRLDVVVDGADEVSPTLDLIKGLGGALLREKAVAQASAKRVIVVDGTKQVAHLGTIAPLPVEVVTWTLPWTVAAIERLGGTSVVRQEAGEDFVSDNGNTIIDVRFDGPILDPQQLERDFLSIAGVVETGLFLGMADVVLVATEVDVVTLLR